MVMCGGNGGAGENDGVLFSKSRIELREDVESQGGGSMLARRCRLSRSASQKGSGVR